MEIEAPLSDNRDNEENEEDDNKSNDRKKKHNENYTNNKKLSKSHTLEDLNNLTKTGQNFNCFLLEQSYLTNLEKWAYSWISIAKSVNK